MQVSDQATVPMTTFLPFNYSEKCVKSIITYGMIFVDYEKSFDSINKDKLIESFAEYRVGTS